jgi:hypothetical protein
LARHAISRIMSAAFVVMRQGAGRETVVPCESGRLCARTDFQLI